MSAVTRIPQALSGNWQCLLAIFVVASLLEVSAWGHIQAFAPLYHQDALGMPEEDVPRWTGILAAAPLLLAAPLSPFWGVLADRYGRKLFILRCFLISAVSYCLAAVATDVWQFLGIRLLQGVTFGSNAVVIAALADLVPQRRLGFAIGMTQMVFPVGNSIGPLFGSGLIAWLGLRGMLAVDAGLSIAAFLLVLVLYQERPRQRDRSQSILQQIGSVGRTVWQTPAIRLTFILFALCAGGWTLVVPFLPVLITRVYQGEDVAFTIGLILAGFGALAAVAAPAAGRVTDALTPARVVTFNTIGLALMSLGLVFAATPWQVGLVMLLGAIPFGASNTALFAHLARHTPREHLTAVMSLSPLARTGAMAFTPLLGAAATGFGLSGVFVLALAVYGVAAVLSLRLGRVSGPAQPVLQTDSAEP
jgi:DHA1 family multidrug resistance protein-like MFS transporter